MAFYLDADGAVWQDGARDALYCIVDPDYDPDGAIGIPMERDDVARNYGPLVEVRPTGWEAV